MSEPRESSTVARLPGWIGLCPDPEHAQEFYMPEPQPGETCPWCENPLIHFLRLGRPVNPQEDE